MDAAIACQCCIALKCPQSAGISGGGFSLVKDGDKFFAYDFREVAPQQIDKKKLKETSNVQKSLFCGVPGDLKGMEMMHRQHGLLKWATILDFVIEMAEKGTSVSKQLAKILKIYEGKILNDPGLSRIFAPNGSVLTENSRLVRKDLAKTFTLLRDEGSNAFYYGELGKSFVDSVRANQGTLTSEDLANYSVKMRDPIIFNAFGMQIATVPAPASGALLALTLKLFEKIIQDSEKNNYHYLLEVIKHVHANRALLGDPDFSSKVKAIENELINGTKGDEIYKLLGPKAKEDTFYQVTDQNNSLEGTTHISVIDGKEMAVTTTTSINYPFGALTMDQKTGLIHNNHLADFLYLWDIGTSRFKETTNNQIESFKRPQSSALPIIMVDKKKEIIYALGATGGTRIISTITYWMFLHFVQNMDTCKALMFPRFHIQLDPILVFYEKEVDETLIKSLKANDHIMEPDNTSIKSSLQLVQKNKNKILAVADPRKGGIASGGTQSEQTTA